MPQTTSTTTTTMTRIGGNPRRMEEEEEPPTTSETTTHPPKTHQEGGGHDGSYEGCATTNLPTLLLLYILSGCLQPILMTTCRTAGLANSSSQLYMFFYYVGPALVILPLLLRPSHNRIMEQGGGEEVGGGEIHPMTTSSTTNPPWPGVRTIRKACGIALFDLCSQTLNYTGASLAGPTIFAIVYSSVTVWTAVFSQIFLRRTMNVTQWVSILLVFIGLTLTATDSVRVGGDVLHGLILVVLGSILHALTYVMLEGIMTVGGDTLTIAQNCAIQGVVAASCFFLWQLVYTLPRWNALIGQPMHLAGTTPWTALGILLLFAGTNLVHALTFLHTLRHVTGGATTAGVLKGLQAVLVFVATHYLFCGQPGVVGGEELCFTRGKFLSLMTVASGVTVYGMATAARERMGGSSSRREDDGYTQIQGEEDGGVVLLQT